MKKFIKNITKFLIKEEEGVIAVIFAVMLIPILALSGATIDYTQASNIRNQMQQAVDAAALAAGREAMGNASESDLLEIAENIFHDNLVNSNFDGDIVITGTVLENGYKVQASTNMSTSFLKLATIDSLPIGVSSEVGFSEAEEGAGEDAEDAEINLDVVLAYQLSYTMRGNRLSKLKHGSKELIEELFDEDDIENVKVGVVPFTKYARISTSNSSASWLNINPKPGNTSETSWSGCVGSRPNDTTDSNYTGSNKVQGVLQHLAYCGNNFITPLANESSSKSAVNSLTATTAWQNFSYLAPGFKWAWSLLSAGAPYDNANSENNVKVIVYLADQPNNRGASYPYHWNTDVSFANSKTKSLCSNIKSAGIKIITIRYMNSDAGLDNVLDNCASPGLSYTITSESYLDDFLEDTVADIIIGMATNDDDDDDDDDDHDDDDDDGYAGLRIVK